jgi:hypothetical protein
MTGNRITPEIAEQGPDLTFLLKKIESVIANGAYSGIVSLPPAFLNTAEGVEADSH